VKKAVDLNSLPAWPGDAEGGTVVVHAADVDADSLRSALAPKGEQWILAPSDERVSGRIVARSRDAAWAGARQTVAAFATSPVRLRGGGVNVDLDFVNVDVGDVFRLLADVSRTNVVMRAPPAKVNLRVKRAGAIAVMNEVARVSVMSIDKPAKNVIVVSAAGQGAVPRLAASGPKVRLDARGAHAGDVLALVQRFEPPRRDQTPTLPGDPAMTCERGEVVQLRLREIARDTARGLVGMLGGVDATQGGCGVRPVEAADVATLELVATVSVGTRRLGLGKVGADAVVIDDADPQWEVGESYVAYQPASGDPQAVQLYPPPGAPPPPSATSTLDQARLALTVVDGPRSVAVIELDGETYRVYPSSDVPWQSITRIGDVEAMARISAGVVELIDPETQLPMKTLRLQAR